VDATLSILLWIGALICVVLGVVGILLPALPGVPLVFGGMVLGAWADSFQRVGAFGLIVGAVLMIVSFVVDWLAGVLGVQKLGASKLAMLGSFLGGIVGLFFNVPGILLGPFIGAVIGEYLSVRNLRQAGKVGLGTFLGMVIGAALKIALIVAMLGVFVLDYALL